MEHETMAKWYYSPQQYILNVKDPEGAVRIFVGMGWLVALAAMILDTWRPGKTRGTNGQLSYQPISGRQCCMTLIKRAMLIPLTLLLILGMVIIGMAGRELCKTPLGYCPTISCICGNAIWQGYVFMFVTLSTSSLLLIMGITRKSTKSLRCGRKCLEKCGCAKCCCDAFERHQKREDVELSCTDGCIVWSYIVGSATICLTGMMPAIKKGGPFAAMVEAPAMSMAFHDAGVALGLAIPAITAVLLAYSRYKESLEAAKKHDPAPTICKEIKQCEHNACGCLGYSIQLAVSWCNFCILDELKILVRLD